MDGVRLLPLPQHLIHLSSQFAAPKPNLPILGSYVKSTIWHRPTRPICQTWASLLPEVPTFAEQGLPGFEAVLRHGLVAPAGTPRPILERLNKELRAALASDDIRARFAVVGAEPLASTSEEYAAEIDREMTKWSTLVKALA
jgi:tripartite-type tricarboxylate transporter receptor subunit TctC